MLFQRIMAVAQVAAIAIWLMIFVPILAQIISEPLVVPIAIVVAIILTAFAFGSVLMFMGRPLGRKICILIYTLQVISLETAAMAWKFAMPVNGTINFGLAEGSKMSFGLGLGLSADFVISFFRSQQSFAIGINLFAIFMIWWLWKRYYYYGDGGRVDPRLFE